MKYLLHLLLLKYAFTAIVYSWFILVNGANQSVILYIGLCSFPKYGDTKLSKKYCSQSVCQCHIKQSYEVNSNKTNDEIVKKYQRLKADVKNLCHQYYSGNEPLVSDNDYDSRLNVIRTIEKEFPDIVNSDSPSQCIGGPNTIPIYKSIQHIKPVKSLETAIDRFQISNFLRKLNAEFKNYRINDEDIVIQFVCQPKIDGICCVLKYKWHAHDGNNQVFRLISVSTRGDGYRGEDIMPAVSYISGVPNYICVNYGINAKDCSDCGQSNYNISQNCCGTEFIEVRGEVYMEFDTFTEFNKNRTCENRVPFSSPRNAAAGLVRHTVSQYDSRCLKFCAFDMVTSNEYPFYKGMYGGSLINVSPCKVEFDSRLTSYIDMVELLKMLNFIVPNSTLIAKNYEAKLLQYVDAVNSIRNKLPFPIDGVVVKINSLFLQEKLGHTNRAPRWAFAIKMKPKTNITKVQDITIQVGSTGLLTPVAMLEPVFLDGVNISRATLHNFNDIHKKDIRIGDTVEVKRAGDVIPQIVRANLTLRLLNSVPFKFPEQCPLCGSIVVTEGGALRRCGGGYFCRGQAISQLLRFVSSDAFDIKGLGRRQIEELYKADLIRAPYELFLLKERKADIRRCYGLGERSTEIILQSIENHRKICLNKFIFSLGIRYIGTSTSLALATYFTTYRNFLKFVLRVKDTNISNNYMINGLHEIKEFGPKSIKSLKYYFLNDRNFENLVILGGKLSKNMNNSENGGLVDILDVHFP